MVSSKILSLSDQIDLDLTLNTLFTSLNLIGIALLNERSDSIYVLAL